MRTPLLCPAADRNGYYLHGWTRQHDALVNQHGQQPLVNRRSQVVWRGRTEDARYPERDALRWGRPWQSYMHRLAARHSWLLASRLRPVPAQALLLFLLLPQWH